MKTRIKVCKSAMDNSPMYYPQYYSEGKNSGDSIATIIFSLVVLGVQWSLSAEQQTIVTTAFIGVALAVFAYFHKGWCSIYFVSDHSHGIRGFGHRNMRQDNYSMSEYDAMHAIDNFIKRGSQPAPKDLNVINYP